MFICGVLEGAIEHYREGLLRAFHGVSLVERCSEKKCKYFYWEVIYLKKAFSYKRPCCNFRTEAWDRTLEGSDMKIC